MSADAEVVPVAWLYESEESCAGPFEARHVRISIDRRGPYRGETETPLYSADTIAELRKVIAAADAMRAADHLIGPGGVDACPKCIAEKAYDLERAAIDAAQSTEGKR